MLSPANANPYNLSGNDKRVAIVIASNGQVQWGFDGTSFITNFSTALIGGGLQVFDRYYYGNLISRGIQFNFIGTSWDVWEVTEDKEF